MRVNFCVPPNYLKGCFEHSRVTGVFLSQLCSTHGSAFCSEQSQQAQRAVAESRHATKPKHPVVGGGGGGVFWHFEHMPASLFAGTRKAELPLAPVDDLRMCYEDKRIDYAGQVVSQALAPHVQAA